MGFKEVLPNIYLGVIEEKRVSQPSSNVYIIKGDQRSLLIDCGYDGEISRNFIGQGLVDLGIRVDCLDILVTHAHVDHIGSMDYWLSQGARLFMHSEEFAGAIRNTRMSAERAHLYGITPFEYKYNLTADEKNVAAQPTIHADTPYTPVEEGDVLSFGGYELTVRVFRGHADAQVCLWAREQKFMFSADQVLLSGCPTMNAWTLPGRYLQRFLDSLQEIKKMDCELLLTGHGPLLKKSDYSIELALNNNEYEYRRLADKLVEILQESEEARTVIELVSRLYGARWEDYFTGNMRRKVIMTNKAFACLEYLAATGRIAGVQRDGVWYYHI